MYKENKNDRHESQTLELQSPYIGRAQNNVAGLNMFEGAFGLKVLEFNFCYP